MHLRVLMCQAFIYASTRNVELSELNNLHLVCFALLTALGCPPALSSLLEIFRTASAAVVWRSTRGSPVELPQQLGDLRIPAHPCKDQAFKAFDALAMHPYASWLRDNLGPATTAIDDVLTSCEFLFNRPYDSDQQIVMTWLKDGQILLRNAQLFLNLTFAPRAPQLPSSITTAAPRTPELWGE